MTEKEFINQIITDTKVKLSGEFARNFERKGFFDKKWPSNKFINRRGSPMMRSGKLRRSIQSRTGGSGITWSSSLPYAGIHNEGGKIKVTEKMKKFFWAMYYKSSGAIKVSTSKTMGEHVKLNDRNKKLAIESQQWKALALMKVGSEITIEQRQFIGDHTQIHTFVKEIINHNFEELERSWAKQNGFK